LDPRQGYVAGLYVFAEAEIRVSWFTLGGGLRA
jgi:hypothetical protein